MKKIILTLLIIHCILLIANAQWVPTNGPYSGDVRCFASNANYLFAGCEKGGVYRSSDNGITWTSVNNGLLNLHVYALACSGNIILAGTFETGGLWEGLFRSTNNGDSWSLSNEGFYTSPKINCLAASGSNAIAGSSGDLFVSTNSGLNWRDCFDRYPNSVVFSGTDVLVGLSDGVLKSTDIGLNWYRIGLNGQPVYSIATSGTKYYAGTWGGGVYFSSNSGNNWTTINNGLTDLYIQSMTVSGNYIYAGTNGNGVFVSSNDGTNWIQVNNGLDHKTIWAFQVLGSNVFAGTYCGGIFRTTNYGAIWTTVNNGLAAENITCLCFNGANLYAGSFANGVYISSDYGTSWNKANNGIATKKINALTSLGTKIFTASDSGQVYLTTNNGGIWLPVNIGVTNSNVYSLAVLGTTIYAGTYGGGVFMSTNNGTNWTAVNSGLPYYKNIYTLAVKDSIIFAGTDGYYVYKSTNRGASWITSYYGITNPYTRSFAVSGNNIFVGTSGVWLSTNNGDLWTPHNSGLDIYNETNSLSIRGTTIIASVLRSSINYGGAYISSNNGTNWVQINQGFSCVPMRQFLVINGNYCYSGNEGQSVWKRDISQYIGIKNISTEIPKEFMLYQNYPNPFNPSTKIRFDIQKSIVNNKNLVITLKVFEITGKEIATLINENIDPGTYEVTFDGSNFASGIYYYQLRIGEFVATKKLVLLK